MPVMGMDTNRERFYEAFAHTSHVIMGRRLRKFSLYHRFWLEAMQSPLIHGGEVSIVDLELACRVCSCRYGQVPQVIEGGAGNWKSFRGWWFALRCLWLRPDVESGKFAAYLADHVSGPNTHHEPRVASNGKVYEEFPGTMDQVCAVIRATGWEPETVWNLGPGEAEWYMAGVYRLRGVDMKVKSEHDEEFEAGLQQMKKDEF